MHSTILLRKLIAIERMIGKADNDTLRNLLYDAEDFLIQMQSAQGKSFFAEVVNRADMLPELPASNGGPDGRQARPVSPSRRQASVS